MQWWMLWGKLSADRCSEPFSPIIQVYSTWGNKGSCPQEKLLNTCWNFNCWDCPLPNVLHRFYGGRNKAHGSILDCISKNHITLIWSHAPAYLFHIFSFFNNVSWCGLIQGRIIFSFTPWGDFCGPCYRCHCEF